MQRLKLNKKDEADANIGSLEDFLSWYFKNSQPETYNYNGDLQTSRGKYRSFSDILSLCCNYFPDCTEKDLAKVLISFWEKRNIHALFCSNIGKVVFCERHNNDPNIDLPSLISPKYFNPNNPDAYAQSHNQPTKVGVDGHSFIEIYNLTI